MSSKKENKGSLTFLHKKVEQSVKDGNANTYEESIIDGQKGLSIKYFSKSGDKVDKVIIYGKDNAFKMKSADGEKDLTKADLLKELNSNKKLKFAVEYAKSQKGGNGNGEEEEDVKENFVIQEGGAKKSKKVSKKSSKKGSKKVSLKGGAKKGSKKAPKKASKKASKKVVKKVSKKVSKKVVKKA